VAFSPDGKHILCSNGRIFDVATGEGKEVIKKQSVSIASSPDGKNALSGSSRRVDLWELSSGKSIKTAAAHSGSFLVPYVWSVSFSADGKYALSGGGDNSVILWDAKELTQLKKFDGHTSYSGVRSVAFSPDGRYAVSSGDGARQIKIWDLASRIEWKELEGHTDNFVDTNASAKFSPDSKFVISVGDASTKIWNVSTGEEVASMIAFKDGEWIVITREGYYNASARGAEQYLSIKVADNEYSVDQFYDVFYRPDIVAAKLRGEDISGLVSITMKDAIRNPPPAVEFTSKIRDTAQSKVNVCYRIKSTGGGIGEVRLFHNGKLVESDGFYREVAKTSTGTTQLASLNSRSIYADIRSLNIKAKTDSMLMASKSKGDLFEDCKEIDAIPGENEVSVAAFNSSNTVQSYMKTVSFNSKIKQEEPHLYILAIGIDQYKDTGVNLKYAVKDARDIEEKIKVQAATLYSPRNIHYELLTDREATKANITNKIDALAKTMKPQDSFILFVAGHGVLLQNQYYLLTHDYNGNISEKSVISSNEIVEMSKKIKSLSQLFIFDTCHAGGVDTIISGLYDARMSVLAKKMGLHIYASASDKQSAMDGYKGNGLFTYTLLDGLNNNKHADKNKDGKVSIVGLGEYSKKMTTSISKQIGHEQTPLIINFGKDSPIYKLQ
jgi:WD40 repeat protein